MDFLTPYIGVSSKLLIQTTDVSKVKSRTVHLHKFFTVNKIMDMSKESRVTLLPPGLSTSLNEFRCSKFNYRFIPDIWIRTPVIMSVKGGCKIRLTL